MARVNLTAPKAAKFKDGDKVTTPMSGDKALTIKGEPKWNGLVWMYGFRGDSMRLGEDYLKPAKKEN
jgi:hypothetical protein